MKDPFPFLLANSDGGPIFFIFVFGFFALVAGLFYLGHRQAKKRREALAEIAQSLDMTFSAEKQKPIELGLSGMGLFKRGRSQRIYNLMTGLFADTDCLFFDYRYRTGSGKNSSTHTQTVVAFKIAGASLPEFTCKPEYFFHKFADMFGFEDINFDAYPVFSKKYRLNGDDADAVKTIFNSAVIEQLEAEKAAPWSVDGGGEWLVIHRAGKVVKPEDCSQFLLDATTLLNAMTLDKS